MGDTVVRQPQPQSTPLTPAVAGAPRTGAPNDQAADTAAAERRARSANAVPPPWRAALGAQLLPPDATSSAIASPTGPSLVSFRHNVYNLVAHGTAGVAEATTYLTDAADTAAAALTALREATRNVETDRPGFTTLRAAVQSLTAGGDIAETSLRILTTLTLLSEDGKEWLRRDQQRAVSAPLAQFVAANPLLQLPMMRQTKQVYEGLIASINSPQGTASATAIPLTPPPPTVEQVRQQNQLITEIRALFPHAEQGPTAPRRGQASAKTRAMELINDADARVRELVFAWRDPASGQGILAVIGSQLSPDEAEEVINSLDPVQRLFRELQLLASTTARYEMLRTFLLAHTGDEGTRTAVRSHAQLMMLNVSPLETARRAIIMRLICTGREQPDAVDRLHEAADASNAQGAVAAILELGSIDATRLAGLRTDQTLVSALQTRCNTQVMHQGVPIKPWDLFLRICGGNPNETREAGSIERQGAVSADVLPPIDEAGIQRLETELYADAPQKLEGELNASIYTNDATVISILRNFARRAARPEIVELLHRKHEAPGPTLAAKTQARGVDVRLRVNREMDGDEKVEALRILGFSVDQAAVGVVGGAGTLATDGQHQDGEHKIPLEQALRETLTNGTTLSLAIHAKAENMRDALGAWFGTEGKVREVWNQYTRMLGDEVMGQLRSKTGLARVWPIELLGNAFLPIGGNTLQARVTESLGGQSPVIREMGLQPSDVASRRTMAEQDLAQTAENERAAHAQVDQTAQLERFRTPAREMFTALANVTDFLDETQLRGVGQKVAATRTLAAIQPAAAPTTQAAPTAQPAAQTTPHPTHTPTTFAELYRQEYGIEANRHVAQVARALVQNRRRTPAQVAEWFGIPEAEIGAAPPPPQTDELAINETNASLVGPGFTVEEAQRRANTMWEMLHNNGQIQLLRQQIDGRTDEEQRLIHIAFRRKSGGIELNFYLQQYRAQMRGESNQRNEFTLSVGGEGADGTGGRLDLRGGTRAETDLLAEIATTGRVSIANDILSAIAGNNMNQVYAKIESATAEERRAILANDSLMSRLRQFGDDSYEWQRIHGSLTGQSDLFDRLESRAHGTHGFLGAFDATDEAGMRADIQAYVRNRKAAITREVVGTSAQPTDAQKTEINTRLRNECLQLSENPSIRAILNEELSGTELSDRQGLIMNAGEESHTASVLNDGDWTEDEEKILSDIRAMSAAERRRVRNDPSYMERLRAAIQTEGTWRDAMIALSSDEGSETEESNFAKLERFSRGIGQDSWEVNVEEDEVIQAMSRLSPEEFARLRADQRLQTQILAALADDPQHLAMARQILGYNQQTAIAATGLTPATDGQQADPAHNIFPRAQVERLAFMVHQAEQRLRSGSRRSWAMLLQEAIAVYNMKLRPSGGGAEGGGENSDFNPARNGDTARANPHAPAAGPAATAERTGGGASTGGGGGGAGGGGGDATPAQREAAETAQRNPTNPEDAIERSMRERIWTAVNVEMQAATASWGTKDDLVPATQNSMVERAVKHEHDPSNSLLDASTSVWGDDEERIKDTLKNASDEQLINDWTTIRNESPAGEASLRSIYESWKAVRPAGPAAPPTAPAQTTAPATQAGGGGEAPASAPSPRRRPPVGSVEWMRRTAFQTYVIDTSRRLEQQLLRFAGGLFTDNDATGEGARAVRDNSEWLEWRTIVRERIPNLSRQKIVTAIGADNDSEAAGLITDDAAWSTRRTLGSLSYDEERYAVDRGAGSNYNMDRITAGGEGTALDNSMGEYRREVLTSVTDRNADNYGQIDAAEQARIDSARERYNTSSAEFRAAKSAVATVAATVVSLIVTAIVTILTAGLATGPVAVILLGAITAGTASLASNAATEAIRGTDFAFSNEGLTNIARDTIMGAVTAGTTWYAGKLVSGVAGSVSAAEQAAAVATVATRQTFLQQLGRQVAENSLQTGMSGLFEAGAAAFDPAMWLDGWNEGWRRGGAAARDRASEIPAEMLRAAVTAAVTTSAGAGMRRLRGEPAAKPVPGPPEHPRHAALGNRMTLGERTVHVLGQMGEAAPEGVLGGAAEVLLDEKTWRAEGQEMSAIAGTIGQAALDEMKDASGEIHSEDAHSVQRVRAGARQLAFHGQHLTPSERHLYATTVLTGNDSGVISVAQFDAIRNQSINEAIAKHEAASGRPLTATQRTAFTTWARSSDTHDSFAQRVGEGPTKTPGQTIAAPPATNFDVPGLREAEVAQSQALDVNMGAAQEAAATRVAQMQIAVADRQQLTADARRIAAQVAVDSPQYAQMSALLARFTLTTFDLNDSVQTATSGKFELDVMRAELQARLRHAQQNPGDQAAFAALNEARLNAAAKEQVVPGQSTTAVATAVTQMGELRSLMTEMRAVADAAVRTGATTNPATPAGPITAPDGTVITQPAVTTEPRTTETSTTETTPTVETAPTTPMPTTVTPPTLETTPTSETPPVVAAPANVQTPSTSVNPHLAGNTAEANPQLVHAAIARAIETGLPPGATREGGQIHIPRGDEHHPLAVTVEVASEAPSHEFAPIATVRIEGDAAKIVVAQGASAAAVERAVAGKLAELDHIVRERMEGRLATKPSALVEGSQSTELSPADINQVAQLRMAMRQIEQARQGGDASAVDAMTRDTYALMVGMGLLEQPSATPVHQAPSQGAAQRVTGPEAATRRQVMIMGILGPDSQRLQSLLASASSDARSITDIRTQRAAARERLRAWSQEMIARRQAADAALKPLVDAAIGADGTNHVFDRLIVGGGWSATADFITSGAQNSGALPSTMAISLGGDPWSGRGDLLMGQNAAELELRGFAVQPSDLADDPHDFARSSDFAGAVGASGAMAGMPTYSGQVSKVEPRPDGDASGWPANARYRLTVNGKSFYANSVDILSGPGPARTPQGGQRITDPSGFAIDARSGQFYRHLPGSTDDFHPIDASKVDAEVSPEIRQRLRQQAGMVSRVFVDRESRWSVDLSTNPETYISPEGERGSAPPDADIRRRLGVNPNSNKQETPALVDQQGRITSNRVVDSKTMHAVDPSTRTVYGPDGAVVDVSTLSADVQNRLGFTNGQFRDPRFHAVENTAYSVNPVTGDVIHTDTGAVVPADSLDETTRKSLEVAMQQRRLSFGGGLVKGDYAKLNADGTPASVLIYGAGASGAWDVEQAAGANSNVDWAGNLKMPPADAVPATDPNHALLVELHKPETTFERRQEIMRDEKLRALITSYSFKDGYNRRNTAPGYGAYSSEVLNEVTRGPRTIIDIQSTTDGKYFVQFNDGSTGFYDHVTISIGQNPGGEGGVGDLTKDVDKLQPIKGVNGDVVGATDGKGLRVGGAAAVTGAVVKDFENSDGENIRRQGTSLPLDSKNVNGGIVNSSKNIAAMNEASMTGSEKLALTDTERTKRDELLAAHPRAEAERLFQEWREQTAQQSLPPITAPAPEVSESTTAKVGVNGNEVPTQINRLEGLPPEQTDAEKRFAEAYEANPDAMAQQYLELVMSGQTDKEKKNFATDDAKLLSPDYNKTDGTPEENLAARGMMNLAVHQTGNAIAKRAFQMRLDQIAEGEGSKQILVTAGGVGAGKSFAIKNNPEALALKQQSAVVWDSAGEQNSTELRWVIEEAKKRGLQVAIVYVHRRPEQSWENMDFGVIPRAKTEGRMVDARLHADSYAVGARNFDAVQKEFSNDSGVQTLIIDATDKPTQIPQLPPEALNLDADAIAKRNVDFLNQQEGLPEHVKQGGAGLGHDVWGDPTKTDDQLGPVVSPEMESKRDLIKNLADNSALAEQHAHADGSAPLDAVFAESDKLTTAQRQAQMDELVNWVQSVAEAQQKYEADKAENPAKVDGKDKPGTFDNLNEPGKKLEHAANYDPLEGELALINGLYQAKARLQKEASKDAPNEESLANLRARVNQALAAYRSHMTMRKGDYERRAASIDTNTNFFLRYRMITGHELTVRQIASSRSSNAQLGSQEVRQGVGGKDLVNDVKTLSSDLNEENRYAEALGDDADVTLIVNTTKSRSGKDADEMANLVDEWHRNPEMQKAVSGLDNAGVESAKQQPILLWKMSAKRAFHNAELMHMELRTTFGATPPPALLAALARVTSTTPEVAAQLYARFYGSDEDTRYTAANEQVSTTATVSDNENGEIKQTFNGLTIEQVARDTRAITDALRIHRAETGSVAPLPKQLGYTVHAGEQIVQMNPFELLRQVEQTVGLGVDRIGHALILGISTEVLLRVKQEYPNGEGGLTPDQVENFRRRQAAVLEHVKQAGVVVEMNITSNTEISNLTHDEHPADQMIKSGLRVTVSTDDETTLNTTVADELRRLATSPNLDRTDLAIVILESYHSRMGARELGNRGRLKSEFRTALMQGMTDAQRGAMVRDLADEFGVLIDRDDRTTLDRVLDTVFGVGGVENVNAGATP